MNAIPTANTWLTRQREYTIQSRHDVTGHQPEFRLSRCGASPPNVSGARSARHAGVWLTYFAGYTFTTPPASARSETWAGTHSGRLAWNSGIWASQGISDP